ncbi:putative Phloem protein 2-B15 [Hibiscus syriacus]|uniref:Phloem protein 2-B15 n=2 Tax=Hibiscus syriacus TaxID=106335 RepID=A0A6A2Y564_HIBSY|nr:putative Phloem protein 2-B15 [Hibiscus syriacus]
MLSARELDITWADNPLFWSWKPFPTSRFHEVAELRTTWWLEIQGKINSRMLSPTTTYEPYLIVKFVDRAYGLDFLPSEVSVEVGNVKSEGNVYLRQYDSKKQCLDSNRIESVARSMECRGIMEERVGCKREDGWTEIELGSFYNHGGDDLEVKMSLKEVNGTHLKGGLVVEGIELRPKQC